MKFLNEKDYDEVDLLDELELRNLNENLYNGVLEITNITKGNTFKVKIELSQKEIEIIKAGGKLNYTKNQVDQAIERI